MKKIILNAKQLREFEDLHPMLRKIYWALVNLWPAEQMTIRSIHRTREHDQILKGLTKADYKPGIHTVGPPYRAMDLRVWALGSEWQKEIVRLAEILNDMFIYDPARPEKVVCYVKKHGTGPHIHLQVHPDTRRRDEVAS